MTILEREQDAGHSCGSDSDWQLANGTTSAQLAFYCLLKILNEILSLPRLFKMNATFVSLTGPQTEVRHLLITEIRVDCESVALFRKLPNGRSLSSLTSRFHSTWHGASSWSWHSKVLIVWQCSYNKTGTAVQFMGQIRRNNAASSTSSHMYSFSSQLESEKKVTAT